MLKVIMRLVCIFAISLFVLSCGKNNPADSGGAPSGSLTERPDQPNQVVTEENHESAAGAVYVNTLQAVNTLLQRGLQKQGSNGVITLKNEEIAGSISGKAFGSGTLTARVSGGKIQSLEYNLECTFHDYSSYENMWIGGTAVCTGVFDYTSGALNSTTNGEVRFNGLYSGSMRITVTSSGTSSGRNTSIVASTTSGGKALAGVFGNAGTTENGSGSVPEGGILEDFSDGLAQKWIPVTGNWSVSDGCYTVSSFGKKASSSYYDTSLVNFELEVKIRKTAGASDNIGLFFRGNPAQTNSDGNWSNGYSFFCGSGDWKVTKYVNGYGSDVRDWTHSSQLTTGINQWVMLKIRCVGSQIEVYINGVRQATINDTAFSSGKAGIKMFDDAISGKAEVDYITITPLTGNLSTDSVSYSRPTSRPTWPTFNSDPESPSVGGPLSFRVEKHFHVVDLHHTPGEVIER